MIAIVNISSVDAPLVGLNKYEVRINDRVVTAFQHARRHDGLADCLRDAADAVEAQTAEDTKQRELRLAEQLAQMGTSDPYTPPAPKNTHQRRKTDKAPIRVPTTPSEALFEYFTKQGISINDAATTLGVSVQTLLRIKSNNTIPVKLAVLLEKHFNLNARRVLQLEATYKEYKLHRELERADLNGRAW